MIEEVFCRALLPAAEHVIEVYPIEVVRCALCASRKDRQGDDLGDIILPLLVLFQRPCERCATWLSNENGLLIAGLVVLKGAHASVRMR